MPRPKIVVLMPIWRRHALTAFVLRSYQTLRRELLDSVELDVCVIGSEGTESRHLAEDSGWNYVEHENRPLGAKWNAGLRSLRKSADAVLIAGSDDVVTANLFRLFAEGLTRGLQYQALLDMYFYDLKLDRLMHWAGYVGHRRGEPIGFGRLLSHDLLERLDWTLWDEQRNRGLDGTMTRLMRRRLGAVPEKHRFYRCIANGIAAVDIKTEENITSYDSMRTTAVTTPMDARKFFEEHFAIHAEALDKLRRL